MTRTTMWLAPALAACALTLWAALPAGAEDWPTYRGPRRNCSSSESGLQEGWPADGPKLVWKTSLEPGNSSPVVANGRVYCLGRKGEKGWNHPQTNKPEGPVLLYCLDRSTGQVVWKYEMPLFNEMDNAAMNTATVDGDRVYVRGGGADVHCVSCKDGSKLWRWPKDDEPLKKKPAFKGTTLAPDVLIVGDLAIFTDFGSGYGCGKTLIAVNKLTGEPAWQYKRTITPAYDTLKPEMLEVDGKRYMLADNVALDIPTGKVVYTWADPALTAVNVKASTRGGETGFIGFANAVQGNVAYMNFSRAPNPKAQDEAGTPQGTPAPKHDVSGHGLLALRFEHDAAGALKATKLWEWIGDRGSWVNSPVVAPGALLMNLTKQGNDVVCLDPASGKELWKQNLNRLPKVFAWYSEPLYADGKFFISTTDLYMIAADPKEFRVLGSAKLNGEHMSSGGGGVYHAPALSDGFIFARNNLGTVFCFDIRKNAGAPEAKPASEKPAPDKASEEKAAADRLAAERSAQK